MNKIIKLFIFIIYTYLPYLHMHMHLKMTCPFDINSRHFILIKSIDYTKIIIKLLCFYAYVMQYFTKYQITAILNYIMLYTNFIMNRTLMTFPTKLKLSIFNALFLFYLSSNILLRSTIYIPQFLIRCKI